MPIRRTSSICSKLFFHSLNVFWKICCCSFIGFFCRERMTWFDYNPYCFRTACLKLLLPACGINILLSRSNHWRNLTICQPMLQSRLIFHYWKKISKPRRQSLFSCSYFQGGKLAHRWVRKEQRSLSLLKIIWKIQVSRSKFLTTPMNPRSARFSRIRNFATGSRWYIIPAKTNPEICYWQMVLFI